MSVMGEIFHEVKDQNSIQRGAAELNRILIFHRMKYFYHYTNENIHYLFYITWKIKIYEFTE